MTASQLEWFNNRFVKVDSGCWLWYGGLTNGYGCFSRDGYTCSAHKISYEHFVGPVPLGICVLHKCDNRRCVNPEHLFLGTRVDNNRDMAAKGRHGRGATIKILTEAEVERVREVLKKNANWGVQKHLAETYGVSQSTISEVKSQKRWKVSTPPSEVI